MTFSQLSDFEGHRINGKYSNRNFIFSVLSSYTTIVPKVIYKLMARQINVNLIYKYTNNMYRNTVHYMCIETNKLQFE